MASGESKTLVYLKPSLAHTTIHKSSSSSKNLEIVHDDGSKKPRPKKFIPERDQQWFSNGFVKTITEHAPFTI